MASSASTVNALSNDGSSGSVDNTPSVVPPSRPPFSFAKLLAMSEIDQSDYDWPSSFDEEPGDTVESEARPGPGFKLIPLARRGVRAMRVAKNERGSPEPFKEYWLLRKCSHCSAVKTPKWRYGPEGPNTLCNACGMRYKSGRLVPEYRPANSPTTDPEKHSNLHNKVLELRKKTGAAADGGSPVV